MTSPPFLDGFRGHVAADRHEDDDQQDHEEDDGGERPHLRRDRAFFDLGLDERGQSLDLVVPRKEAGAPGEGRDDDGNSIGGGLIPGDSVVPESLTITGSIINVGTETNRLASSAQITNKAGKDVTGNYSINYVNGLLTITPAAVVVKADDKTKVYGNADPELTAHVYGLINESDVIEYSLSRAEGENVGNYTITPTGEAQQGNYIVTYETGTLTITPKPLTITGGSDTKIYDGTLLTKNSYIKTDLAEGDVISSVTVTGSQTYVGKSDNVPSAAEIRNAVSFFIASELLSLKLAPNDFVKIS